MIPLEDFFRKPDTVYVRLSPDGSHLGYMAPHERRLNVFVRNLETGETTRVTDSAEYDRARTALEKRYDLDPQERDPERTIWIYRLDPRAS